MPKKYDSCVKSVKAKIRTGKVPKTYRRNGQTKKSSAYAICSKLRADGRRGMGVGSGKQGYYNMVLKDPLVHSLSAKGVKTLSLQRVPYGSLNPKLPKNKREYIMAGGSPVGTIKEWKDFAKKGGIKKLEVSDLDKDFEVSIDAKGVKTKLNMMGLKEMQRLNDEAVAKAKRLKLKPMKVTSLQIKNMPPFPFKFIGDYVPKGYKLVDKYFVDSSGLGSPSEPAMTVSEFTQELEKNVGKGFSYALTDVGQFQVYVGKYKKVK